MHAQFSTKFTRAGTLGIILLPGILAVLGTVFLLSILGTVQVVSAPQERSKLYTPEHRTSTSNTPVTPTISITKTIVPTDIDVGDVVSICFTVNRTRLDVVLAQDVSGSMGWTIPTDTTRLTESKKAVITFVHQLRNTDRAAVVAFSKTIDMPQSLTTTHLSVAQAISDLKAKDCTNMLGGISAGHSELISSTRADSETIKTLILLSDGEPTCPDSSEHVKDYEDDDYIADQLSDMQD